MLRHWPCNPRLFIRALGPSRRSWDVAPWVGLILTILVLRAPGFVWPVLNIDESDFYLYGQSLVQGGETYVTFVEKKPPFVYGFFALLIGAGADDLRWIRAWTALWVFLGCLAVRRMSLLAGLESRAAWVGTFAFGVFSSNISVATDCETLMNLPVVCSAWLAMDAAKRRVGLGRAGLEALAGVAAGVAVGFKHQAGMALVALVGFFLARGGERRLASVVAAVGGFAAVVALVSGWFWATGRWDEFLEWNLLRNLAYTGEASPRDFVRSAQAIGLYGLANGVAFLGLGVWGVYASVRPPRDRSAELERQFLLFASWLYWTAWVGVAAGGRFYGHYFLQLVPGGALLAAAFWQRAMAGAVRFRRLVAWLMCLSAVGFGANTWSRGLFKHNFPSQDLLAVEMAQWLREKTAPDDRVFVWGYFNPIYYLADRRPASRFINPSPVVGDFDPLHVPRDFDARPSVRNTDAEVLVRDLESNQCAVFLDTAPSDLHGWSRFPLRVVPVLERYVREKFTRVEVVAGAEVWRRRPETGAATRAVGSPEPGGTR